MNKKLKELTDLLEKMNQFRPLSRKELEVIENQLKIEHIWSSNAIEGNSLTKYETASVLETGLTVSGKPIKDYLEVSDLSRSYDYVKELATQNQPLFTRDIRDINRLVTLKTSDDSSIAGAFRVIPVYPKGFPNQPYLAPHLISENIDEFLSWYNEETQKEHPVVQAALAHFYLVSIHPFTDGNGRTSRLLMNFTLMRNGYPIINIQPDAESREQYMKSLANARENNNPTPFVELVVDYAKKSLEERVNILENRVKQMMEANKDTNLRTLET